MKVILVGHPGSQFLVPASEYLTRKYLPGFDVCFLNHEGDKKLWSKFVKDYLLTLDDKLVIFALDDYLVASPMNMSLYEAALRRVKDEAVCINLHRISAEEHVDYPVTTQYTIWNRQFLIWLLSRTTDPWDFEINGSRIMRQSGKYSLHNMEVALEYGTSSALSARWRGVSFDGLSEEDKTYIINRFLQ